MLKRMETLTLHQLLSACTKYERNNNRFTSFYLGGGAVVLLFSLHRSISSVESIWSCHIVHIHETDWYHNNRRVFQQQQPQQKQRM